MSKHLGNQDFVSGIRKCLAQTSHILALSLPFPSAFTKDASLDCCEFDRKPIHESIKLGREWELDTVNANDREAVVILLGGGRLLIQSRCVEN